MVVLPLILASSLLMAAQGGGDQPRTGDPIVVTGTRISPQEARERAFVFVRAVGFGMGDRPVARWEEPVCLRIQGLRERYARAVEDSMRAVAQGAGVRLAAGGCEPNVTVAFTNDPLAFVQAVQRRAPHYLLEIDPEARARVMGGDHAVRWLYSTRTQGIDGRPMMTGGELSSIFVATDPSTPQTLPPNMPVHFGYGASSVSTGTARVLNGAAVIVDLRRLDGQTLGAIGAYAALVAFAEIRPSETVPSNSILGLFQPDGNRPSLTEWDRTFLGALYRIPLDRGGRRHRAIMMRELVAAMTGAGTAEP